MMGRSHLAIGTAVCGLAIGAGLLEADPITFGAVALGSLAPDIEHPRSTLGRLVPFISWPLNKWIGHRTATHPAAALATIGLPTAVAALLDPLHTRALAAFVIGYGLHIAADLLTAEGCALAYPNLTRFVFWPAVHTGGPAEPFVAGFITLGLFVTLLAWFPPPLAAALGPLAVPIASFLHAACAAVLG
jgi:inner membrane protein